MTRRSELPSSLVPANQESKLHDLSVGYELQNGVSEEQLKSYQNGTGVIDLNDVVIDPSQLYRPQGSQRELPVTRTLREVIPQSLLKKIALTGGADGPIGRQFIARPDLEHAGAAAEKTDFLQEENYHPVDAEGQPIHCLTHKYGQRVLATFTYDCAAYCRFCTRGRHVGGAQHTLPRAEIDRALEWITQQSAPKSDVTSQIGEGGPVNEVILSGGDPLMMRPSELQYVTQRLGELQRSGHLDMVRVGTRLPIHHAEALRDRHYEAIAQLERPNILLHINHPTEITTAEVAVFDQLRAAGAVLRSQTVLLAGVNDDAITMHRLMRKLVRYGVVPYYVFTNDQNFWNDHFTVSVERAREIFADFRQHASGLESSFHVAIDVGGGRGKVPIPVGEFWQVDFSQYLDFDGTEYSAKNVDTR